MYIVTFVHYVCVMYVPIIETIYYIVVRFIRVSYVCVLFLFGPFYIFELPYSILSFIHMLFYYIILVFLFFFNTKTCKYNKQINFIIILLWYHFFSAFYTFWHAIFKILKNCLSSNSELTIPDRYRWSLNQSRIQGKVRGHRSGKIISVVYINKCSLPLYAWNHRIDNYFRMEFYIIIIFTGYIFSGVASRDLSL